MVPWLDYILNIKSINFALFVLWEPGRPWELWQDHLWVVTSTMLIVYSALRCCALLWILQSVHLLGLSWIEHLLQEVEQCDETEVSLVVALSASWLLLNTCEYLQRTPNTISHKSVHTCEAQSEIEGLAESCSTCILKTTSFQTKKRKKMITIQKSLQHASRGYQQWRVIGMLCSWYNVFFQSLTICFHLKSIFCKALKMSLARRSIVMQSWPVYVEGMDPSLDQALEILTLYKNNILCRPNNSI